MKRAKSLIHLGTRIILAFVFVLPLMAGFTSPAAAKQDKSPNAVYTITNAASGNEVLVYDRAEDGSLTFQGAYSTDGLGSGAGLGSQGALALSDNYRWLFAVNAGSNEISAFRVQEDGLELVDVVDSGGVQPISLTTHGKLLYVVNAGESGNISGFEIGNDGSLAPIAGSTQPLSNGGAGAAPGPAQISFGPDGDVLVVTEKASNLIVTYQVEDGIAGIPVAHDSAGATPFGFAFDKRDHLIVSEAFGGAAGASALSSYEVDEDDFELISPSVPTTQTAACWVVISKNGKYAYTTNTGSSSISSYRIGKDGSLTLLDAQAGLTGDGSRPIDMALSNNGRYLYAISGGTSTISIFQVKPDGSLVSLGKISVPAGSVGLAAR
ncbi:MAG: beta-propeller fold lactonase family protein [Chloroflexota bacterium]